MVFGQMVLNISCDFGKTSLKELSCNNAWFCDIADLQKKKEKKKKNSSIFLLFGHKKLVKKASLSGT